MGDGKKYLILDIFLDNDEFLGYFGNAPQKIKLSVALLAPQIRWLSMAGMKELAPHIKCAKDCTTPHLKPCARQ